jgi:hypothetical protein
MTALEQWVVFGLDGGGQNPQGIFSNELVECGYMTLGMYWPKIHRRSLEDRGKEYLYCQFVGDGLPPTEIGRSKRRMV